MSTFKSSNGYQVERWGDVGVEVRLDGINRGALLELAEEGCRSVGIPVSEARKLLEAHEYDLQHPGGDGA